MLAQSSAASCGPCAVSNALKALGLNVDEAEVLRWMDRVRGAADPGAEGTGSDLMARALAESRYRIRVRKLNTPDTAYALLALRGAILDGAVAVLYVDADPDDGDETGHWVAAVGISGRRFLVADGADRELVLSYDDDQLTARWETPGHYALVIARRNR